MVLESNYDFYLRTFKQHILPKEKNHNLHRFIFGRVKT